MLSSNKVYYLYSTEFGLGLCNIRYIGQTKHLLEQRLKGHIKDALKHKYNIRSHKWIRSVYAKGFEVKIGLLVDKAVYNVTEIEQIAKYRALGYKLTNGTDGGGGVVNPTKEVRRKIGWSNSIALKGKKKPPRTGEHQDKLNAAHRGKKRAKRAVDRQKKSLLLKYQNGYINPRKGTKNTEEHNQKVSKTLTGYKHTDEAKHNMHLASMSEKNGFYGKKHTEEFIEKMKIVRLGNTNASGKRDEVAKQNMKDAWKLKYENGYVSPLKGRVSPMKGKKQPKNNKKVKLDD